MVRRGGGRGYGEERGERLWLGRSFRTIYSKTNIFYLRAISSINEPQN